MLQTIGATLWILAVIALAAAGVWRWQRETPYSWPQFGLFVANLWITRLLWRAEMPPRFPVTPGQGAVIIANHRSSIDPFFIQVIAGRVVHWMVTRRFFEVPGIGWFLRTCESIPTSRSGVDTGSTKRAIRLASQGGLVGMFPEGRINRSAEFMQSVRPGAAMVALRAKVPIVPCYIEDSPFDGTPWGALMMAAHVKLHVGEPLDLSSYAGREHEKEAQAEVTLMAVKAIAALAKRPDFKPELAGRTWSQLCE